MSEITPERVAHLAMLARIALTDDEIATLTGELGAIVDSVAKVGNANGTATLPVFVSGKVAPGCAWVESGYGATAPLLSGRVEVRRA